MKVTTGVAKGFEPVDVTITLESDEELGMLYALFNYAPICGVLQEYGLSDGAIREALNKVSTRINYHKQHKELNEAVSND